MKFTLTMDMDSAAFRENGNLGSEDEAKRILHKLAEQLSTVSFGPGQVYELVDYNYQKVGEAEVVE